MRFPAKIWLFWLVFVIIPGRIHAQLAQSSSDSSAVLRATTHLVQVDVVVTDGSGRPIKNLKESDFSITEDGRSQKLAFFSFQEVKKLPQIQANTGLLPPHVTTNRPEFRHLSGPPIVLLLDGINTPVENQLMVRKEMLKFLADHFDSTMRVAVFAMGNELSILQDFTSDPALLRKAMEKYRS